MRADCLAACALVLCAVLVASASAEASPKTAHQRLLRLVRSNLHEAAREDPNVGALLETEGIIDEFLDDIQQGFKDFGKGLEEMANDIEDVVRNKVAPALAVKREVFGDGAKHYRRPVVMFAGVMGLKMEGKARNDAQFCGKPAGKFYTLWINLDKCFAQALAMDILPDGTSVPRSGVDVRVFQGDNNIERGFMKALKELDGANLKSTFKGAASNVLATVLGKTQYFSRFYHNLKDVFGYKSGVDIFAAPVDWRLNPALHPEVFQDVLMIVEKAFISNKRRRTVFMCHSMGGLVALQFIRLLEQNDPSLLALIKKVAPTETISPRAWALSRIESVLFVNSPLAGSQKIWMNLIGGETLLEPAIHRSTMLEVSRTLDVTSLLAPVMPAFHNLYPPTTALIIEDKAKSKFLQFKYDEFDKALELMSRPAPERAMIARTVGKPELGPGISPPELIVSGQIKANFITVRNVKTPLTYRYSKKDLPWTADGKLAWDALTTVDPIFENNVEGDGTVPQKSAEFFYNWKSSTGTAVVVEDCHALKPRTNPKAICHWVSPLEAKLNEHQSIVYFNKEVIKQMVAHAVTLEPVDEPRTIPNEGVKGPAVKGEQQQQQFQALAGAAFGAVKQ